MEETGNKMTQQLNIYDSIVLLERGKDELLLVNAARPRPLYVKKGRDYVKKLIDAIGKDKVTGKFFQQFPKDHSLLHLLRSHHIVECNRQDKEYAYCSGCAMKQPADNMEDSGSKRKFGKRAISLYLLLSQSCNMDCIYCLNGKMTYHKDNDLKMDEKVAFAAVNRCLGELSDSGTLEIVFFGGEPLLNWPMAQQVILQCENVLRKQYPDRHLHYHLTTNLTIFPDDLIDWIKKYSITILCDVDGPAHLHNITRPYRGGRGSHTDTARNIYRLRESGIEVALRSTITSFNVDHMVEVSTHHKELGGSASALVAVNAVTSDREILPESMLPDPDTYNKGISNIFSSGLWEAEELFPLNSYIPRVKGNELMSHGCGAPCGNTPVVDVKGDVYACIYLVGISRFMMGNILDGTYPRLKVGQDMLEVLHVDKREKCRACRWRYLCGGGCPVGKLTVAGNPMASRAVIQYTQDIACKTSKAMIETLLWKYAEERNQEIEDLKAQNVTA